ncbi:TetR/AcrR family transcriptional regulator [Rhodopila sp.]|jgi:AcrR family transcriptional regulator|uniref:TetR/AcrR family transcriptional regulator n=1 Tax=Rhodopila sp. TaxID=2480087 RepID=UPI002B82FE2A|nr:helix-turn-helix domain-containing protein [Rhodopila sp.]HVZ07459.1 helix-turn-helix domain-containing protein [Rhodopila sp.]
MQDLSTRDRIMRAAMRLFVAHGIDAVSLRDIADAVGIKAPSLYAHFRSRDALVQEMFQTGYAAYGRRLAAAAATEGRFPAKLDAMVRTVCRLQAEDDILFGFLLLTQHAGLRSIPIEEADNPVRILCDAVAAGMAAGDIPPRDPVLIAAAVMGVILQPATFLLYGRLAGNLSAMQDQIVALAMRVVS